MMAAHHQGSPRQSEADKQEVLRMTMEACALGATRKISTDDIPFQVKGIIEPILIVLKGPRRRSFLSEIYRLVLHLQIEYPEIPQSALQAARRRLREISPDENSACSPTPTVSDGGASTGAAISTPGTIRQDSEQIGLASQATYLADAILFDDDEHPSIDQWPASHSRRPSIASISSRPPPAVTSSALIPAQDDGDTTLRSPQHSALSCVRAGSQEDNDSEGANGDDGGVGEEDADVAGDDDGAEGDEDEQGEEDQESEEDGEDERDEENEENKEDEIQERMMASGIKRKCGTSGLHRHPLPNTKFRRIEGQGTLRDMTTLNSAAGVRRLQNRPNIKSPNKTSPPQVATRNGFGENQARPRSTSIGMVEAQSYRSTVGGRASESRSTMEQAPDAGAGKNSDRSSSQTEFEATTPRRRDEREVSSGPLDSSSQGRRLDDLARRALRSIGPSQAIGTGAVADFSTRSRLPTDRAVAILLSSCPNNLQPQLQHLLPYLKVTIDLLRGGFGAPPNPRKPYNIPPDNDILKMIKATIADMIVLRIPRNIQEVIDAVESDEIRRIVNQTPEDPLPAILEPLHTSTLFLLNTAPTDILHHIRINHELIQFERHYDRICKLLSDPDFAKDHPQEKSQVDEYMSRCFPEGRGQGQRNAASAFHIIAQVLGIPPGDEGNRLNDRVQLQLRDWHVGGGCIEALTETFGLGCLLATPLKLKSAFRQAQPAFIALLQSMVQSQLASQVRTMFKLDEIASIIIQPITAGQPIVLGAMRELQSEIGTMPSNIRSASEPGKVVGRVSTTPGGRHHYLHQENADSDASVGPLTLWATERDSSSPAPHSYVTAETGPMEERASLRESD